MRMTHAWRALFVLVWWITLSALLQAEMACCCLGANYLAWQSRIRRQNAILFTRSVIDIAIHLALHSSRCQRQARTRSFQAHHPRLSIGLLMLSSSCRLMLVLARNLRGVDREHLSGCEEGAILIWRDSHVWEVSLSTNRGLFVWAPVTLLAVIGVKWRIQADCRFQHDCFVQHRLVAPVVTNSWSVWYGGHSFGPRVLCRPHPVFLHWAWQRLSNDFDDAWALQGMS